MDRLKMALSYEHCSQRVNQQGGRRSQTAMVNSRGFFFLFGGTWDQQGEDPLAGESGILTSYSFSDQRGSHRG